MMPITQSWQRKASSACDASHDVMLCQLISYGTYLRERGVFIHIEHFLGGAMPHWHNVLKLDERLHRHQVLSGRIWGPQTPPILSVVQ